MKKIQKEVNTMKTYFRITAYSHELDISFIIDSVNQYEHISDLIGDIISKCSIVEGSDSSQFDEGNIPKANPNGNCYILRACMKGRVRKQDRVISINGRHYNPHKGK